MTDRTGASHPRRSQQDLVRPGADEVPVPAPYVSVFDAWYDRATVRTRPRRTESPPVPGPGEEVWFSPELAPVATHPLVAAHGPEAVRRVLVRRLYDYLHFTAELEQVAVLPVTSQLARGRAGIELPPAMRADAAAIVTDEAFHAQVAYDLASTAEARTGVRPGRLVTPGFIPALDRIRQDLPADLVGLEDLVFAIVSETLITATLVALPRDQNLPRCVRDVVLDHAVDEGRHHAFFAAVLERLWLCLDRRQAVRVGVRIPEMIDAFLRPDVAALDSELRDLPLRDEQRREVTAHAVERTDHALVAAPTVRYFEKVGALDPPQVREAFAAAGLLESVRRP